MGKKITSPKKILFFFGKKLRKFFFCEGKKNFLFFSSKKKKNFFSLKTKTPPPDLWGGLFY
jgi:hypothetical protein